MLTCFSHPCNADEAYGFLSSWTWSLGLSNNHTVLPIHDSCCSRLCCPLYPQQEDFLDWNSEAPHWLLWRTVEVIMPSTMYIPCYLLEYQLQLAKLGCVFHLTTGNVPRPWLAFTARLLKVILKLFTGNTQNLNMVLLLVALLPEVSIHLHEGCLFEQWFNFCRQYTHLNIC